MVCPNHLTGPKHFIFSEVAARSLQDRLNTEDSALSPSALASEQHINPVTALILPYFTSPLHREMKLIKAGKANATLWVLGLVNNRYVPNAAEEYRKYFPNPAQPDRPHTPIGYATFALGLDKQFKQKFGNDHDGFCRIATGTTIAGVKGNYLADANTPMQFCSCWYLIAYYRAQGRLLSIHPYTRTYSYPKLFDNQGNGNFTA